MNECMEASSKATWMGVPLIGCPLGLLLVLGLSQ